MPPEPDAIQGKSYAHLFRHHLTCPSSPILNLAAVAPGRTLNQTTTSVIWPYHRRRALCEIRQRLPHPS